VVLILGSKNIDGYSSKVNGLRHGIEYKGFRNDLYSSNLAVDRVTPLFVSTQDVETEEGSKASGLPPWLPPFATAATGGFLFGSDIGCSSSVVRLLGSKTAEFGDLTALQLGQIASSSLFGAMIASGALVYFGDIKLGRKDEFKLSSLLFLTGTLIQSLSPSLAGIYVGRIIFGLGIGTAMHVAPLYIAETAPNELRGKLVSLKEAAIVMGIVLGYGAGAVYSDGNWRGVFQTAIPFELFMVFSSFFVIPESPRWLALRSRPEEAVGALQQVNNDIYNLICLYC
jgi:MFS family permease